MSETLKVLQRLADKAISGATYAQFIDHLNEELIFAIKKSTTVESSAVQRSPIKPVVDPDLDANQRLAFKLGWKSAEEAHNIK
jgi:hypothetical protein